MREDCFGNRGNPDCAVLNERVGVKCLSCSFYATREQVIAARAKAAENLSAKGLCPKTKTVVTNDGRVEVQSVVKL